MFSSERLVLGIGLSFSSQTLLQLLSDLFYLLILSSEGIFDVLQHSFFSFKGLKTLLEVFIFFCELKLEATKLSIELIDLLSALVLLLS